MRQVREQGRDSILCPVCETHVTLADDYELGGDDQSVAAMDASADAARDFAVASMKLLGEEEVDAEFDIFLFHSRGDEQAVRELARRLRERGLRTWPDHHGQRPAMPWQRIPEWQYRNIPVAAVIVGPQARAPWEDGELAGTLQHFRRHRCPVIPVILAGARRPELPPFLEGCAWIDLAATEGDPLEQLERRLIGS